MELNGLSKPVRKLSNYWRSHKEVLGLLVRYGSFPKLCWGKATFCHRFVGPFCQCPRDFMHFASLTGTENPWALLLSSGVIHGHPVWKRSGALPKSWGYPQFSSIFSWDFSGYLGTLRQARANISSLLLARCQCMLLAEGLMTPSVYGKCGYPLVN